MLSRYIKWLEQELDANLKLIEMLRSVPETHREDPRYQQATDLGAHICACRENWLFRMTGHGTERNWWPKGESLEALISRTRAYHESWTEYFQTLDEHSLIKDFEFGASDGNRYRWNIEGQIMQMVGHAFYHRGQIASIVDQLGGKVIDTDYLYWAYQQDSGWGIVKS